jgi:phosphatidylglycerol---prolipoprotein diacylglyceryl transferase
VNAFAITLGLGAGLGLYRISRQRSGQWLDAALLALLCALVGARLGFALENFNYYQAHPDEILAFNRGGLGLGGAVLGWVLGLLLSAWIHKTRVLRLADWIYPLIPPLTIAGLLGCWQAGVAYGPTLPTGAWWGIPTPDEGGLVALRWPLQPAAALALLVFYWLMELLTPLPRPTGWLSSLASTWFIAVALVVSLLRADPVPNWGIFHADTLEALVLLTFFLGLFVVLTFISRKRNKVVIPV